MDFITSAGTLDNTKHASKGVLVADLNMRQDQVDATEAYKHRTLEQQKQAAVWLLVRIKSNKNAPRYTNGKDLIMYRASLLYDSSDSPIIPQIR